MRTSQQPRAPSGRAIGATIEVRRPALILNPHAGTHARDRRGTAALADTFARVGEVAECSCHASLRSRVARLRADGVDLVVLSGGDGTFHVAVRELVEAYGANRLPAILFLHGGTTGDVASSLGSHDPALALEWLVTRLHRCESLPVRQFSPLEVDGRIGFNCGVGWCSDVPALVARLLPSGAASASRVRAGGPTGWARPGPWVGEVLVDGRSWSGEWGGFLALSIDHVLGRRMSRTPEGGRSFSLLGVRHTFSNLRAAAQRWLLGPDAQTGSGVEIVRAERVELRGDPPGSYMSDGEFYAAPSVLQIRLGPRFLVVQPPSPEASASAAPDEALARAERA